jgi:hypothetical protein
MIGLITPSVMSWILARRAGLAGATVRLDPSKVPEEVRELVADAELLYPFFAGDDVGAILNEEYVRAAWGYIKPNCALVDRMAIDDPRPSIEWTALCSLRDVLLDAADTHGIDVWVPPAEVKDP